MYEELYDFVANIIIAFMTNLKTNNILNPGQRFALRLDNENFVKGVYDSLVSKEGIEKYEYKDSEGIVIYKTYKLVLPGDDVTDIIIVPKIQGITDSFLTTLRNHLKSEVLIMLVTAPNDSILTTTEDLSSVGGPFSLERITNIISREIDVRFSDKKDCKILTWALNSIQHDRYSDNTSIWAYKDLIKILYEGQIQRKDYSCLGLFYDSSLKNNKISKFEGILDANHSAYEDCIRCVENDDLKKLEGKYPGIQFDCLKKCVYEEIGEKLAGYDYRDLLSAHSKSIEPPLCLDLEKITFLENVVGYSRIKKETRKLADYSILCYNELCSDVIKFFIPTNLLLNKENLKVRRLNLASSETDISEEKPIFIESKTYEKKQGLLFYIKASSGSNFYNFHLEHKAKNEVEKTLKDITFNVCILNISKDVFSSIHQSFFIENSVININEMPDEDTLIINPNKDIINTVIFSDNSEITCSTSETLNIEFKNGDLDEYHFKLKFGNLLITFSLSNQKNTALITEEEIFYKKFHRQESICCHSIGEGNRQIIKIISGGDAFNVTSTLNEMLRYEYNMIVNECFYLYINSESSKTIEYLSLDSLPNSVVGTYLAFIRICRNKKTLPSLAYYETDPELKKAAQNYIESVKAAFLSFPNTPLTVREKELLRLGCVSMTDSHGCIVRFSPLHPLNVQYQLLLQAQNNVEDVRNDFLPSLNPLRLVPFIREEDYTKEKFFDYHYMSRLKSLNWCEYANLTDSKYSVAQSYVPAIISDKIYKYITNFKYLFDVQVNYEITISLCNMGDCAEVLAGIIKFYEKYYFTHKIYEDFLQIKIFVLDDGGNYNSNVFYKFASQSKLSEFVSTYVSNTNETSELINVIVKNVKCYFIKDKSPLPYTHLTFFKMKNENSLAHGKYINMTSGYMMDGLVSSVIPTVVNSLYRTGYGTEENKDPNCSLLSLAEFYNSAYTVMGTDSEYSLGIGLYSSINMKNAEILNEVYEHSNWVVFVEPEVDLSFFNKSPDKLMIVHYSDKHSNTSGYDDITVSAKSGQYERTIIERLKPKLNDITSSDAEKLIRMFNALNGGWLLDLISSIDNKNEEDNINEKFSLLAATNLGLACLHSKRIKWVPISMESILRVNRRLGLSKKEGLLSAENLKFKDDKCSDDLLFVGIEETQQAYDSRLKVYFYPVEVKIASSVNGRKQRIDDGIKQLKNAYEGYANALGFNAKYPSLNESITRNLFMQIVIANSEKMDIYSVDPTIDWKSIYHNRENRRALLDGKYEFCDLGINGAHGALVVFYQRNAVWEKDSFSIWEYSGDDIYEFLKISPSEIRDKYQNNLLDDDEIYDNTGASYWLKENNIDVPINNEKKVFYDK